MSTFPVRTERAEVPVEELETTVRIVPITFRNIDGFATVAAQDRGMGDTLPGSSGEHSYRVGAGDLLEVTVWDHPELSPASAGNIPVEAGLRVGADGSFFYPYVGQVPAAGLSVDAIRMNLTEQLSKFITTPQVQVKVVGFRSQSVSMTGAVEKPSRLPINEDRLTLLDAVDAAGGLTADADAARINLRRNGRLYRVNLAAFLDHGSAQGNPPLRHGDVVTVPRRATNQAYLLGQVKHPGTIDLTQKPVSLTAAIALQGGAEESRADVRGIFVFRRTGSGITVYQLNASSPAAYVLGARFALAAEDVIYVTTAPIARWNRLISNILPSVTVIGQTDNLGK